MSFKGIDIFPKVLSIPNDNNENNFENIITTLNKVSLNKMYNFIDNRLHKYLKYKKTYKDYVKEKEQEKIKA